MAIRFCVTAILALGWAACAAGQPSIVSPPVAPISPGDRPSDEVTQLEAIGVALKDHFRPDNPDTRFIIDRNDKGIFSAFSGVGLVHAADGNVSGASIGTGTLVSPCFVLTAYHVTESQNDTDSRKKPRASGRMMFSVGPISGRTDLFSRKSLPVTVHDPKILDPSDRQWSDDFVLLRFDNRLDVRGLSVAPMSHVFEKPLPEMTLIGGSVRSFFVVAGYPASMIQQRRKFELFGDFCRIFSATRVMGLSSECVLTPGMSGGPLFFAERQPEGNYAISLVAVSAHAAVGSGLFVKTGSLRSYLAPLTPNKIAKIKAVIDRPTDEHCMPIDGKPW